MYCRNCGAMLLPGANVCTNCGVPVGAGRNFCPNCATPTGPNMAICVKCGYNLSWGQAPWIYSSKSAVAAGILGIFLGSLGVHNFYLGYTGKAVAQLLITLLSCGILSFVSAIWGLIEGILLLTGRINRDGQGYLLMR